MQGQTQGRSEAEKDGGAGRGARPKRPVAEPGAPG